MITCNVCVCRLLVHKLREGAVDGLTMVYGGGMSAWAPLAEVPELKKVAQEIAEEESRAAALLSSIHVGTDDQTFSSEMYKDDVIPTLDEAVTVAVNSKENTKEFVNDEGIRHVWDVDTDEWVVAEDGDGDEYGDGDGEGEGLGKSEETSEFLKEINDGNDTSNTNDDKPEKRKRNKKKKKKNNDWNSTSNLWVYVDNLPLDITVDEIKAHFSKVSNYSLSVPLKCMYVITLLIYLFTLQCRLASSHSTPLISSPK